MKIRIMIAAVLLVFTSFEVSAQQITIGTFNIRYDNPRDSGNLWVD
ncbi:MAG: endonuclease, partial [Pedobacter sp.]